MVVRNSLIMILRYFYKKKQLLLELFIDKNALTTIIDKLIVSLLNQNDYALTLDTCASLASYISTIIYTKNSLLTYSDNLLLALFNLSCKFPNETEIISSETLWEVNTSWQDSIAILLKHLNQYECHKLTEAFAKVVETVFFDKVLDENYNKHLITIIVNYLKSVRKSVPLYLNDLLNIFFKRAFTIDMLMNISHLCQMAEYICGNLCSPYKELQQCDVDIKEIDILCYFAWCYIKLGVLSSNLNDEQDFDDESDVEEIEELIVLQAIDDNEEFIAYILYDLCLSSSYLDNYLNTKYFNDILQYYEENIRKIQTTIKIFDGNSFEKLKTILKHKAFQFSWFWCKAIYLLYTQITPVSITEIFNEITKDIQQENLTVLHFIQIFGQHLNYDYINFKLDTISNIIVLKSLLHCNEIDVQIAEVFTKMENIRNENNLQFYYDKYE